MMDELEQIYATPKSDIKRLEIDFRKFKKTIKYAKFTFYCWVTYLVFFGLIFLPTSILYIFLFLV